MSKTETKSHLVLEVSFHELAIKAVDSQLYKLHEFTLINMLQNIC